MRGGLVYSGSGQHDAVKCERLREASEVGVAMQDGETAVLGGRGGDQRVGERYAVIAIAALGELGQRPPALRRLRRRGRCG